MPNPSEDIANLVESLKSGRFNSKIFELFHYSVQAKLWEARVYAEYINKFDENNYKLSTNNQQTTTVSTILDKEEIAQYANLYADGFFISSMSIFDALACEINCLFKLIPPSGDINFLSVHNELKQKHASSATYKVIKRICCSLWWKALKNYRNTATHEAIVVPFLDTTFDSIHKTEALKCIYLPDDPKKRPYKYTKQRELNTTTDIINRRIDPFINLIYKKLKTDLSKSGQIPIK